MNAYFRTTERVQALQACVLPWIDTPFAAHACVKGAGVDCVRFASAVMAECGVLRQLEFPAYTIDGGLHRERSQVLEWLDGRPEFAALPNAKPSDCLPGDILVFASARGAVEHHVGVYLGGRSAEFANAMIKYGVKFRTLRDGTWSRLLRAVYRPVEVLE